MARPKYKVPVAKSTIIVAPDWDRRLVELTFRAEITAAQAYRLAAKLITAADKAALEDTHVPSPKT